MKIMGDILGKLCHCIGNNENLIADDALERVGSTNSWEKNAQGSVIMTDPCEKGD